MTTAPAPGTERAGESPAAPAPLVSVIVVAFNGRDLVRECLRRVPRALDGLPGETIVVDNGSHDGTPEMIRAEFPAVHLLATGENLGFAAGNNRGLRVARGRFVVFLNPDTEAAPGSLARLVRHLQADGTIGIAGPMLTNGDGSLQPSARGFPTFGVSLIVLCKLHRLARWLPAVRRYDRHGFDYRVGQDVEQLMGACLVMPRHVVDAMQGFDERFWMWFEEVDLCLRVTQAGLRVRYCPDATVLHRLNQSAVLLHSVFMQRMYARSLVAYFRKHFPAWQAAMLRAVAWIGVAAARVVQGLRRAADPKGRRYRLDARDARAFKALE